MNILKDCEIEVAKNKATERLVDFLGRDVLNANEELQLITSAQTLLFLSILENKNPEEIARNRAVCAAVFEKLGHENCSLA